MITQVISQQTEIAYHDPPSAQLSCVSADITTYTNWVWFGREKTTQNPAVYTNSWTVCKFSPGSPCLHHIRDSVYRK